MLPLFVLQFASADAVLVSDTFVCFYNRTQNCPFQSVCS